MSSGLAASKSGPAKLYNNMHEPHMLPVASHTDASSESGSRYDPRYKRDGDNSSAISGFFHQGIRGGKFPGPSHMSSNR